MNLRNTFLAAVAVVFLSPATNAFVQAHCVDHQISDIRKWYGQIEGYSIRPIVEQFGEDGPDGFTVKRYFWQDELVKLEVSLGGDHGVVTDLYYYHKGELFFVFRTSSGWRFAGYQLSDGNEATIETLEEHRVYISDLKVIRHLQKRVEANSPEVLPEQIRTQPNADHVDPEMTRQMIIQGFWVPQTNAQAELEQIIFDGRGLE
ncbi:MAG: hypothetical protein AAF236_11800 [Verrucomicrobiota bacterium]